MKLALLLLASCAAPLTVAQQKAHFEPQLIVGIGSVSGIKNAKLAENTANNRARADVQPLLLDYVNALVKAYMDQATKDPAVEQYVGLFMKGLDWHGSNKITVVATEVKDGVTYARAELKIADMLESLRTDKSQYNIEDPAKTFFLLKGEAIFNALPPR